MRNTEPGWENTGHDGKAPAPNDETVHRAQTVKQCLQTAKQRSQTVSQQSQTVRRPRRSPPVKKRSQTLKQRSQTDTDSTANGIEGATNDQERETDAVCETRSAMLRLSEISAPEKESTTIRSFRPRIRVRGTESYEHPPGCAHRDWFFSWYSSANRSEALRLSLKPRRVVAQSAPSFLV